MNKVYLVNAHRHGDLNGIVNSMGLFSDLSSAVLYSELVEDQSGFKQKCRILSFAVDKPETFKIEKELE